MYLSRKVYIGANYEHRKVEGTISLTQGEEKKPIKVTLNKVSYIIEEVAYWRKANQIHKWFVDNVQDGNDDCGSYYVSREKLQELLDLCKKIKATAIMEDGQVHVGTTITAAGRTDDYDEGAVIKNAEEIAQLLPAQGGFFFGETDYDQYYMRGIENTIKQLEPLLEDKEDGCDFEYSSSW